MYIKIMMVLTTANIFVAGIYGHSTVYHYPTQTFYIFGGYTYAINRTVISNKLYALYWPTRMWTVLPTFENYNPADLYLVSLTVSSLNFLKWRNPKHIFYCSQEPEPCIQR